MYTTYKEFILRRKIKKFIPPIILDIYRSFKYNKYGWKGNYQSWDEAQKVSIGYTSDNILKSVRDSMIKVRDNTVVYERDGVVFDEIQYSWPLLAGLMFASSKSKGVLKILDFGGSLGTTYYQNKRFLDEFDDISWSIVEQKHFVDIGKLDFQNAKLKFFYDVKSCVESESPNVLLISSVLQYLENPYDILNEILTYEFEFVIFDRTQFSLDNKDKIKLQIVPPFINNASYPCWFFDEMKFIEFFKNKKYVVIEQFTALEGKNKEYEFKGFIMRKK